MSAKIVFQKNVVGSEHDYKPLHVSKVDPKSVLGGDICPVPYCNSIIVAKTGSGKTSVLSHMLKCCAGKALVVVFNPLIDSDESWRIIREKLKKNGNKFIGFASIEEEVEDDPDIEEDDDGEGDDESLVEKKPKSAGKVKMIKVDRLKELFNHFKDNPERNHTIYKGKICPRLIVIMDDMGRYLKHPSVTEFLKNGRHLKAKFIISTQGIHDVLPEALRQMRQWLIFRGFSDEKIKKIHNDAGIPLDLESFWKIYTHATREPYSFLLINENGGEYEYRSKFRHRYKIENII